MDARTLEICEAAHGDFVRAPSGFARDASLYLAHCIGGRSIRSAAAALGAAPSTVSRAVRRVEAMRDDPLMDHALDELETAFAAHAPQSAAPALPDALRGFRESAIPFSHSSLETFMPCETTITHEPMTPYTAKRGAKKATAGFAPTKQEMAALTRLMEPEAFLMVAKGAEKVGVFCRTNNFRRPLAMLPLSAASRMLTHEYVKCFAKSDLSAKYKITDVGRAAVRRSEPAAPAQANGFAEAPSAFAAQHRLGAARTVANPATGDLETVQVNLGESPLGWLARRRDAKGAPLLTQAEVEAGERLREDYEMAQMGPKMGQDWRRFLTPASTSSGPGRTPSEGPMFARDRVAKALDVLGPGLSDAAIRICCFLEGLEATERRMGWSARSGKVVLKLALQRLVDHYGLARSDEAA